MGVGETEAKPRDHLFGESEDEISRLDLQHFMFRWEFGSDFLAPIQTPTAILDVACGTGRWARDMARRFPGAAVIGFDINREQMDRSLEEGAAKGTDYLPDNCTFTVSDALRPFDFADASFDLTMARATSAFVPVGQWPQLVREMTRVTRHGGWVEIRDFGLVRSQSSSLDRATLLFAQLAAARRIHPGVGPYLEEYIAAAQLQHVAIRRVTVQSGPQASRGGRLMLTDYLTLLGRVTPLIARSGLLSETEWEQLVAQARYEAAGASTAVELTAACGQRP